VALVRTGLANLVSGGVTYGVGAGETALPADKTAIVNAYTAPGAYIGGIAAVWILNIKGGLSTMDRLRGRALESLTTVVKMIGAYPFAATLAAAAPGAGGWIQELDGVGATDPTFATCVIPQAEVSGFGATEAPRGALMHLVTIKANVITKYQAVVPTTWNASPKDASLAAGPMEKAMEGIPYSIVRTSFTGGGGTVFNSNTSTDATYKAGGGVEALRVAQSFDPCIACAVH
jgi:Ni,Fe-hydrogenase I large subunit